MQMILSLKFFERSAVKVARDLLGKFLVRRWRGKEIALMITEVEAYHGFNDKASHAARGLTPRNKIMFGEAGYWYIYFIYGTHWMLNIVTGKKGVPSAVLIRGVKGFNGPSAGSGQGPGKLTKTFHINKSLNGKTADKKSGLWVEDRAKAREARPNNLINYFRGIKIGNPPSLAFSELRKGNFHSQKRMKIKKSPRIGVDYAGPVWSKKHWRFYLEDKA